MLCSGIQESVALREEQQQRELSSFFSVAHRYLKDTRCTETYSRRFEQQLRHVVSVRRHSYLSPFRSVIEWLISFSSPKDTKEEGEEEEEEEEYDSWSKTRPRVFASMNQSICCVRPYRGSYASYYNLLNLVYLVDCIKR